MIAGSVDEVTDSSAFVWFSNCGGMSHGNLVVPFIGRIVVQANDTTFVMASSAGCRLLAGFGWLEFVGELSHLKMAHSFSLNIAASSNG